MTRRAESTQYFSALRGLGRRPTSGESGGAGLRLGAQQMGQSAATGSRRGEAGDGHRLRARVCHRGGAARRRLPVGDADDCARAEWPAEPLAALPHPAWAEDVRSYR